MIRSRSCDWLKSDTHPSFHLLITTTTIETHRQPIYDPPSNQMPRTTRASAATSRNKAPRAQSPPKSRKRAISAADTENARKRTKPTLVVEQEEKGGRKGKVAKDKAQKRGKRGNNRCATCTALFFLSFYLTNQNFVSHRKTSAARAVEDANAGGPPAHLTPCVRYFPSPRFVQFCLAILHFHYLFISSLVWLHY